MDQVGLAPCADVQPPSMLCHAFSHWRLNCFFQVVFLCSASLYFQYFNAPLNLVPTFTVVSSHI